MRTPRSHSSQRPTPAKTPSRGIVPPPPTPDEIEARRQFIDNLLKAGATVDQIATLARQKFSLDKRTVEREVADLRRLLREELAAADSKVEQLGRLRNDLLKMRSERSPRWSSIAATERLISEIEGNLAPRKLQHDFKGQVPDVLAAVLSGMSGEELEDIAAEQREIERKAAAYVTSGEPVASPEA